jgi:hypothetical protein
MIYNMLTISVQLLLIGFFVGVIAYFVFPQGRSRIFIIELGLSILGAFLGTLFEVMIRSLWDLPLIYHMVFQFVVPAATSVAAVVLYRIANSVRD